MKFPVRRIISLFILTLVIGCSGSESEETTRTPDREVSEFAGQGRVVRILENSRLLQIQHGDMEGFMPAMTMPFEYRADSIRNAVSVGDSIHFRVASDGIDNWIIEVDVIR